MFLGAGQIATAVVAQLAGREVLLSSAGHPPALALSTGKITTLGATAPPLGVGTAGFPVRRQRVGVGDVLVVVSDGIIEARQGRGPDWGQEALERLAARRASEHPADLAEAIMDAASAHAGGRFGDDATVVVLRRQ